MAGDGQPWTAVASFVISLLALGVAGLSLSISWRKERREFDATKPIAFATVTAIANQPGWYRVDVRIENRSSHGYRCDSIRIVGPWRARGLRWRDAHKTPVTGGTDVLDPLPIDLAKPDIPMNIRILKAGSAVPMRYGMRMGEGDNHVETLFVFARSSIWSRTLSIRVRLLSMQPKEERSEIAIERTLPQAPSTAMA